MNLPVLPGDGIGPVVIEAAIEVLDALETGITAVRCPFGHEAWMRDGEVLSSTTERAIRAAGVALLGAGTSCADGPASPILTLRRRLELDLLVRPALGITVVGHAWAGLYGQIEIRTDDGVTIQRVLTHSAVDRLIAYAASLATRRLTVVDKPTVFRLAADQFRRALTRHAPAGVIAEVVNADAFVADVIRDPARFDVVVAESFLSDVLSDLTAALDGGVGTAPSMSLGPHCAVFEPIHGSAPRRVGESPATVNPLGAMRALAMLLDHIQRPVAGARLRQALRSVRADDCTPDLGGQGTTESYTAAVVRAIQG
ncbi:MAG: isocitrate/isopropylmalate dehydrogenase [Kiritimatiellia bacterium]|jgi:isocitrate/isopropylmalate dehydrogenase